MFDCLGGRLPYPLVWIKNKPAKYKPELCGIGRVLYSGLIGLLVLGKCREATDKTSIASYRVVIITTGYQKGQIMGTQGCA